MNEADIAAMKSTLLLNTKMTEEIHGALFGTKDSKGLREIVATHSLALKIIGLVTVALVGAFGTVVADHLLP